MMKKYLSLLLICLLAWPGMAGERKKVAVVLGSRYTDRYRGWDQYGGDCRGFVCYRLQPG